eukprot:g46259.t1
MNKKGLKGYGPNAGNGPRSVEDICNVMDGVTNSVVKQHLLSDNLTNFYRCTIESILPRCITVWYGNHSAQDRKKPQNVVCTAQTI